VTGDGLPAGVNARDAVDLVAYMERMRRKRAAEWQMESLRRRWGSFGLYPRPYSEHERIIEQYVAGKIDVDAMTARIGALEAHELPPLMDD
jgi:hypothetical protein